MALPSSGELRLSQIKTEFGGGSPPANFRAYLKGGGYVTVGDSAPNVPTSGAMEIRDFLGAVKNTLVASLSTATCDGYRAYPPAGNATTNSVTCIVTGGSGSYTYQWSWDSGDAGWTILTPTSAATAFRHMISSADDSWIGQAICTVTDTVTGFTAWTPLVDVSASAGVNPGMSLSLSSYSAAAYAYNGSGTAGSVSSTATASGGTAPYTYSWARSSGATFSLSGTSTATCSVSQYFASATAAAVEYITCTATDYYGQQTTQTFAVTLGCYAALSFGTSPGNASASGAAPNTFTTGASAGAGAGGTGSYTYAWTYVSGTSFTITSASSASTTFSKYYSGAASESGTYRLTISDGYSTPVSTTITVSFSISAATTYTTSFYPTANADGGGGATWASPANGYAADGVYASVTPGAELATLGVLVLTGFGMGSTIASNAVINWIKLHVKGRFNNVTAPRSPSLGADAFGPSLLASAAIAQSTTNNEGTSSQVTGVSRSALLDGTFEIQVTAANDGTTAAICYLDCAWIEVNYTQ